jgi:hypothetical protein
MYDVEGECHRHAPMPHVMFPNFHSDGVAVEHENTWAVAYWPIVSADNWCGDWMPAAVSQNDHEPSR